MNSSTFQFFASSCSPAIHQSYQLLFLSIIFTAGAMTTNPANTISQIKRILGKRFDDPAVQADIESFPFKCVAGPNGEAMVEVEYLEKTMHFTPEQIMAALLVDLRELAEKEQGTPVTDAVISVPVFYTEAERHAMLTASQVAGFNCLRLLDETTATALAYGIYKTDLPENEAINVAFVDVGHNATQVCIVALKKGQLAVLANAWDRNLGGRDFDRVLFDHFTAEFDDKHKINVRSNPRSAYRLLRACERTKRVLTTNPEAPINVESLTPDVDANGMITRDIFEEKAKPILDRLLVPVQRAVQDAGLTPDQIHNVEVVGGSTRVASVLGLLTSYFGKEPSRTLNAKETPARGCALQCAMLSPAFKVREFQVQDAFPYGVQFSWDKDGETVTSTVFERGSHVPSAKMLTFYRSEPFELTAQYTPDSDIPSPSERHIGKWTVGPFPAPAAGGKTKLKVKIVLNLNGIVAVDTVNMVEEEEVEVAAAAEGAEEAAGATDTPMADAGAPAAAGENGAAPAPAADAPAGEGDDAAAAAPKKKVKTRKTPVPIKSETGERSKEAIQKLYEVECEMALQARIQEETADARNAVESYVYSLRNRLADSLSSFTTDVKREELKAALEKAEDWLYDEGEDQPKSVYTAKLAELKKLGDPIERRAKEAEARPAACVALRQKAEGYLSLARGGDPNFVHLSAEELEQVAHEAESALAWLSEKEKLQGAAPAHEDPVLVVSDIEKKMDTISRVSDPILSKPPPKPEPVPAPAPAAAPSAAEDAGAAEGMDTEDGPPGDEEATKEDMQE
jgi:heat shock protein 4